MTPTDKKSYVFGPVASRRLGRSLGVDVVRPKTCSYDCIYCQIGRTTLKTLERAEYVPTDEVIEQVREKLARVERPDYITFSGSGEPTLHSRLGEIVAAIKRLTDVPVAILTNGSLLWDAQVRRECAQADLIVPSLDAGDEALFRFVNRPHADLDFSRVVEGLIQFRRDYGGRLWLEVLLLAGVTALPAEVEKIRRWVERIEPDRIQVNTVVRPPAEGFAFRIEDQQLTELARLLGDKAEVITELAASETETNVAARRDDILALLARRPSAIEDIAFGLGVNRSEVAKCISGLLADGSIRTIRKDDRLLFALEDQAPKP